MPRKIALLVQRFENVSGIIDVRLELVYGARAGTGPWYFTPAPMLVGKLGMEKQEFPIAVGL